MDGRYAWLAIVLALALPAKPTAAQDKPAEQINLEHRRFFSKGSYSAFAFTFSALNTELAAGRDYDAAWKLAPTTFPADTVLDWFVPAGTIPNKKGVWGYYHLDFGNYDGNPQKIAVAPKQVRAIAEFRSDFDWSHSGSTNFNLLHEFYLTRSPRYQPQGVHQTDGVIEIGFFLHIPDVTRRFHMRGTVLGPDHVNGGVTYSVRRNQSYITFAPVDFGERLNGTIDWKAALDYLAAQGAITGDEYVNGIGFGVEPTLGGGKGRFTVRRYQVTFR